MIKPYARYNFQYYNISGISSVVACNVVKNNGINFMEIAFSLYCGELGVFDYRYVNGERKGCFLMDRTLLGRLREELPREIWMNIPEVRDFAKEPFSLVREKPSGTQKLLCNR